MITTTHTRAIDDLILASMGSAVRLRMLTLAYTCDVPRSETSYLFGAALRTLTKGE